MVPIPVPAGTDEARDNGPLTPSLRHVLSNRRRTCHKRPIETIVKLDDGTEIRCKNGSLEGILEAWDNWIDNKVGSRVCCQGEDQLADVTSFCWLASDMNTVSQSPPPDDPEPPEEDDDPIDVGDFDSVEEHVVAELTYPT